MTLLKFLSLMVTLSVLAFSSAKESCLKLNTCVCMFSNKSVVDLWPVDGSSTEPSFTQIPEAEGRVFEWNPCTPFSTDVSGCNNVTTGTFTSKFACAFPTHQTLPGDPVQQKDEVIN
ncbi:unnamed protein product [Porites evermanni]|uniref:Uncharacterized protein n=1 Tax=Porites evermanni TaxID=104178 RepID=A0ABN8SIZ4_9CNID|nr:unnamed protein product [Porites evermanni]